MLRGITPPVLATPDPFARVDVSDGAAHGGWRTLWI